MDFLQQQTNTAQQVRNVVGPYARAILVTTPQGNYLVGVDDVHVGMRLRFTGANAADEIKTLTQFCRPDSRLLVVGAHIGTLAIPLAKVCRAVVAIEANPETFELLHLNVQLNGLTNCRAIHKAASNRVEQIEFLINRVNSGGSKRSPIVKEPAYFHDNPQIVRVDAAPIDDLLPGEVFDVIVMDIEGSEYFALQGMQRLLAGATVLQIEYLTHHLRNVAAVTAADFVAQLSPHFVTLCIPRRRLVVGREEFLPTLSGMYDRGEGEEVIFFLKHPRETIRF
jgi:FkbM family methyltransferase